MAALSDYADRFSRVTRSIKSTAISCTTSGAGPFTRAILTAELGDLIRDIDPAELGLFNISLPSNPNQHDRESGNTNDIEITRAEFRGATPLRKPATRREELLKPKEVMPEVYAQAAMECIDRYQNIRPMPRAHSQVTVLLEQLEGTRERIRSLIELSKQPQFTEIPSLKSVADEEQQHIDYLQAKIEEYRKAKESLLTRKSSSSPNQTTHPGTPLTTSIVDPVEEQFWSTPATNARALRFSDNLLMDEEAEFGDLSMVSSLASPIPPPRTTMARLSSTQDSSPFDMSEVSVSEEAEGEAGDGTIILPTSSPSRPSSAEVPSQSEPETVYQLAEPDTSATNKPKVRINVEIERIVAKIWSTAGDLIMPGNTFNTSNNKPPAAKATIAHLQSLSSLIPTPASPTQSISTANGGTAAQPTAQQILTAHLLLSLLYSDSLSLSLGKVKELLTAKASTSGSAAMVSSHSRVLYGCVAKRLLKIERGGGGQTVKYDI